MGSNWTCNGRKIFFKWHFCSIVLRTTHVAHAENGRNSSSSTIRSSSSNSSSYIQFLLFYLGDTRKMSLVTCSPPFLYIRSVQYTRYQVESADVAAVQFHFVIHCFHSVNSSLFICCAVRFLILSLINAIFHFNSSCSVSYLVHQWLLSSIGDWHKGDAKGVNLSRTEDRRSPFLLLPHPFLSLTFLSSFLSFTPFFYLF